MEGWSEPRGEQSQQWAAGATTLLDPLAMVSLPGAAGSGHP